MIFKHEISVNIFQKKAINACNNEIYESVAEKNRNFEDSVAIGEFYFLPLPVHFLNFQDSFKSINQKSPNRVS